MSCKRELKNENGNNFDHFTPKTQVLFNEAKKFQKEYKLCWSENSNVLLKESKYTNLVRVTNRDVLENLKNFRSDFPALGSGRTQYFNTQV